MRASRAMQEPNIGSEWGAESVGRGALNRLCPAVDCHRSQDWFLPPWHRHGWGLAMVIAARVQRTIAEPRHKTRELFHRFLVGRLPLFGAGEFGFTENSRFGIAARP